MFGRGFALALALAGAALGACSRQAEKGEAPVEAAVEYPDPAAAIRPLYDPYIVEGEAFPAFEQQAPWSRDLWTSLEAMMVRSNARNEPILDFDPVIGAQDYQLAGLDVTTEAVVPNSHAVVRARFSNLGQSEEILYDLVWEGEAWRVDNIRGADWDLRAIAADEPASREG
ncbi:MAG: DUF3828 domain-containing protein [Hyphomonadaceae bacterium]